jgi:predicted transcriptional regulator
MSDLSELTESDMPEWEQEIINLFVGIFDGFGLPKSTAMIYGTLYCAEHSMLQEEIAARLRISTGSASQGLKLLQTLGAVKRQSPIGQRHSVYTADDTSADRNRGGKSTGTEVTQRKGTLGGAGRVCAPGKDPGPATDSDPADLAAESRAGDAFSVKNFRIGR